MDQDQGTTHHAQIYNATRFTIERLRPYGSLDARYPGQKWIHGLRTGYPFRGGYISSDTYGFGRSFLRFGLRQGWYFRWTLAEGWNAEVRPVPITNIVRRKEAHRSVSGNILAYQLRGRLDFSRCRNLSGRENLWVVAADLRAPPESVLQVAGLP